LDDFVGSLSPGDKYKDKVEQYDSYFHFFDERDGMLHTLQLVLAQIFCALIATNKLLSSCLRNNKQTKIRFAACIRALLKCGCSESSETGLNFKISVVCVCFYKPVHLMALFLH